MKKHKLDEAVQQNKSEMSAVIKLIIESIRAQGQIKKLLQDPQVAEIVERYDVQIDV